MSRRRAALAVVLILAVANVLLFAGPAAAASKNVKVRIFIEGAGPEGSAVATGAFTAFGINRTVDEQGNADGTTTTTEILRFPKGTIRVLATQLTEDFDLNPTTCVGRVRGSGVYRVVGGTGAYEGATGRGTYSVRGTVAFAHTNGGCSEEPSWALVRVKARGPISFGS